MAAEAQPLLRGLQSVIPKAAPWTSAVRSGPVAVPQNIAHRGYKAAWPENTMAAFRGAVQVGAHAIETDLRLTADGVVVLSHDLSLKRCFGEDKKVHDSSWDYLSTLKTLREPHEPMPRLVDLLRWLAEDPALEKTWLLLDIKADDKPEDLIPAIGRAIASVPPGPAPPWEQRIVLGCWNAAFFEAARAVLPSFPVVHITWSLAYARHFLPVPGVGFNMLRHSLLGPLGARFLRDARRAGRPVFVWTVNDEDGMRWCLDKNKPGSGSGSGSAKVSVIDGVISDDPKLFRDVCQRWQDEAGGKLPPRRLGLLAALRSSLSSLRSLLLVQTLGTFFYLKLLYVDRKWTHLRDRDRYTGGKEE